MLIVIDMLVDFLDAWPDSDRRELVAATETLTHAFRSAEYPITWVRQEFEPDLSDAFAEVRRKAIPVTIKGTRGCQIVPELTRRPGDFDIVKKRYSAFFGTTLDELIAKHSINTVVIAGINTHACVRTTAIDAYQRDLDVILVREAVGSYDKEHASVSLRYLDGKIASILSVKQAISLVAPHMKTPNISRGPLG